MSTPGEPNDPAATDPAATEPAGTDAPATDPAGEPGVARAPRRTDTRSPHRSRSRALKILFQADVRGVSPGVTLARLDDEPAAREIIDAVDDLTSDGELLPPVIEGATEIELVSSDQGETAASSAGASAEAHDAGDDDGRLDDFTRSLVSGVHEDRVRIDELIARFARRWQISRMPVVDRTVLRLATYELIHEDTSPAIVIDEAVGLAKAMSTDDSGRYVNGVLESIRRELATNPLPREVPAEATSEAEELLDLALTSSGDTRSGDEAQSGDASPTDSETDAASHPETPSSPSEVETPAPDPAEPRDTPQGSDEPSLAPPPHDGPPPTDDDPQSPGDDRPADVPPQAPASHGQPSLFEDSLGR